MITLACTNCKTVLTMDEAFAGGVCRCQHCGTIQTVPSHLKHGSAAGAAAAGQAVGGSKSLYQQTRTPTDAASGLEALGDVVTSSGLGSARLKSPRVTSPTGKSVDRAVEPPAAPAKNPLLVPLLIAVGAVVVLLICFVIYMATRSSASPGGAEVGTSGSMQGGVPEVQGSSFLGVALKGTNIVYILDRANSASDYFDSEKEVLNKSLHSLGPDRTFVVMLSKNGDPDVMLPATGTWNAIDDRIQQVDDALRDVEASSASTIGEQLDAAVRLKPDAIVLTTSKVMLSDEDAASLKKNAKAGVPLYLFEIGGAELSDPFLAAASASGGEFHSITGKQLEDAAK